jgi:hypothetical protein
MFKLVVVVVVVVVVPCFLGGGLCVLWHVWVRLSLWSGTKMGHYGAFHGREYRGFSATE